MKTELSLNGICFALCSNRDLGMQNRTFPNELGVGGLKNGTLILNHFRRTVLNRSFGFSCSRLFRNIGRETDGRAVPLAGPLSVVKPG
jgi:hypothetical protein